MLDWDKYSTIADRYQHKAKSQDREDLRQDIVLSLATAQRGKDNNGGGQLSDVAMLRIANYQVADYWRTQYKLLNGLDCGSCSKAQRQKCREDRIYSECPKAIRLESLSKPIIDSEGNITELGELIVNDKAIDLDAWLDGKTFLLGCPQRLMDIAEKINDGEALNDKDRQYLSRYHRQAQKTLF